MRTDFENSVWQKNAKRPHDPPLSTNGVRQAEETAAYLKDSGMKYLFSSPFYRTLQTADIIAGVLEIQIKVEHGFSEFMNKEWFQNKPQILSREEIFKEFNHIDTSYLTLKYPVFPEDRVNDDVYKRTKVVLDKITDTYDGTIGIVGHGATVSNAGRVLKGSSLRMNYGLCSINRLVKDNDNWHLQYASNRHLTNKEKKYEQRFN